jgi:hypothetical protein
MYRVGLATVVGFLALAELRVVLLQEHEWRTKVGLV